MSQLAETEDEAEELLPSPADWHVLLLRLAGQIPDDLLTEARGWLADGHPADVAQAVAFVAAAGHVPVLDLEAAMMAAELDADGQDTSLVEGLTRLDADLIEPGPWRFSPVPVGPDDDPAALPALLDLTGVALDAFDDLDRAAIAAAEAERATGVCGLWRVWRLPADGSPWPAPRRVYVVATTPDEVDEDQLPVVTARLQDALAEAGETDPQIELCPADFDVPDYQNSAVGRGALLWTSEPTPELRVARVFDSVDPLTGPAFDPGHPRLTDEELPGVLAHLQAGLPVLTTSATMADVVGEEHADVVPLSFRSDGEWIWTDTVTWYAREHRLAPDPALLEHLRTSRRPVLVSDVALHRVLAHLQNPAPGDEQGVWTVPGADPE